MEGGHRARDQERAARPWWSGDGVDVVWPMPSDAADGCCICG